MKYYLLALGLILAMRGQAQSLDFRLASGWPVGRNQDPAQAHKETQYLDRDGRPLPSEVKADHRREISYRDSLAGTIREYYPSGKLMDYATYASVPDQLRFGIHQAYYESGQLRLRETHVADKLVGERLLYYADGTVQRRDQYADDKYVSGNSFTEKGELKKDNFEEEMPRYEKTANLEEIVSAIQRNVRYPRPAQANGVDGRVYVSFNVNEVGDIMDLKVVKGIDLLNEATLDAVRMMHRFASPGLQNGRPVSVAFTVPVTFVISGGSFEKTYRSSLLPTGESHFNSNLDAGQGSVPHGIGRENTSPGYKTQP